MKLLYIYFLNFVPVLDLIGTVTGYAAQLRKLRATKCSNDISIAKQLTHWVGLLLWILYGIEYCTISYIITCMISLIFCSFEIICTLWYREDITFARLRILSKMMGFKNR